MGIALCRADDSRISSRGQPRARRRRLPQGQPEARAAYRYGYNGGRDQFGRKVANSGASTSPTAPSGMPLGWLTTTGWPSPSWPA